MSKDEVYDRVYALQGTDVANTFIEDIGYEDEVAELFETNPDATIDDVYAIIDSHP